MSPKWPKNSPIVVTVVGWWVTWQNFLSHLVLIAATCNWYTTINWYLFLAQKWFLSQNLLHRKLHFLSQSQQQMKEWRKNWRCILAETKLIKVIKNCHQLLRYLGRYIQEGTFDFIGSKDICWTGHFNKSFYNLSSHTLDGEVEHFLLRYCTYVWSLWGPHHRTRLKVPSTYLRSESRDPTK